MNRRIWSALLVLCFVVAGAVGFAPMQPASATTSWPVQLETDPTFVQAADSGMLVAASCSTDGGYTTLWPEATTVPPYDYPLTGTSFICWQDASSGAVRPDGAVYGATYNSTTTVSSFTAVKNGRVLWSTPLSWADDCPMGGASWNNYSVGNIKDVSTGADGNVFFIAAPSALYCDAFLIALNPRTGDLLIRENLGTAWGWQNVYNLGLWTYDDTVVAVDMAGVKHVYDYMGVEQSAQQYAFTVGSSSQAVLANEDGRVFVVSSCHAGTGTIEYSDANGESGSMPRDDCASGPTSQAYVAGPDGTVVTTSLSGDVRLLDPAVLPDGSTKTLAGASLPVGYVQNYSHGITSALVDEDGNFVVTKTLAKDANGYTSGVFVEYIDQDVLVTPTTLLSLNGDGTIGNRPISLGRVPVITDGSLYSPIAHGYDTVTGRNDVWVHKTDVAAAGFGTPVPQGPGFASYDSQKLEYVAMGDSFSSGEGVEPFVPGTGSTGVNECHRSEEAYPFLLEDDMDLNLNLTVFAACSGATTQNITTSGQWGEPAQIEALSESTDVVTLTIGGNDVGFASVLKTCTLLNAIPSSWILGQEAYDEYACLTAIEQSESKVYNTMPVESSFYLEDDLDQVIGQVLGRISTESQVFVVGYPALYPDFDDIEGSCAWGAHAGLGLTSTRIVSEAEVDLLRHVTSLLNAQLSLAVDRADDERVKYVDVFEEFEGHNLCRWDAYITHINYTDPARSYHPNADGHAAFYRAIREEAD